MLETEMITLTLFALLHVCLRQSELLALVYVQIDFMPNVCHDLGCLCNVSMIRRLWLSLHTPAMSSSVFAL